jgi:hypothetical protein
MIGRAAYQQPWRLLAVDPFVFGEEPPFTSPRAAAAALIPYIERELGEGARLHAITRHLHGLFQAVPGARAFRRRLAQAAGSSQAGSSQAGSPQAGSSQAGSPQAGSPQAGAALLREALALVSDGNLDEARAAA